MNKFKLIAACSFMLAIIIQTQLDGAGQRKYYTGSQVIAQRQATGGQPTPEQVAAYEAEHASTGGFCTGGSCPYTAKTKTPQQVEQEELQKKITEQEKQMADQAEMLRKMQEQLDALLKQQGQGAGAGSN